MKPIRIGALFAGALMSAGVICVTGCSSTTTGSDGGGTDSGGTMEGGGGDSGGEGGALAVSCTNYCSIFKTNCGTTAYKYPSDATCMKACAALTLGMSGDTSMDTIACRQYHATAAAMDAKTHCPHASAYGASTCGANDCESFCKIDAAFCTGGMFPFTGANDCASKCGLWATSGMAGDAAGNTLQCREYHLLAAGDDPATHCAHTGDTSAVCK